MHKPPRHRHGWSSSCRRENSRCRSGSSAGAKKMFVVGGLSGMIEVFCQQPLVAWKNAKQSNTPMSLNPSFLVTHSPCGSGRAPLFSRCSLCRMCVGVRAHTHTCSTGESGSTHSASPRLWPLSFRRTYTHSNHTNPTPYSEHLHTRPRTNTTHVHVHTRTHFHCARACNRHD